MWILKVLLMRKQEIKKKFEWIQFEKNSCRYDAFLTVFCLALLNKDPIFFTPKQEFKKEKLSYVNPYHFLYFISQKINKRNFNSRFELWKYFNQPIHPSISGATKVALDLEGIGQFGSVSVLVALLNHISKMKFYYLLGNKCENCEFHKVQTKTFRVPIVFEEINANSLQGCFDKSLERKYELHCFKCIKKNLSQQYLLLNCPDYIVLYLETENGNINFKGGEFHFDESLIITYLGATPTQRLKVKYKMIATINYPYLYHFNSSVKDPKIGRENLNGWYLHDSKEDEGKLIPRKGFYEIIKEKLFVFFYKLDLDY